MILLDASLLIGFAALVSAFSSLIWALRRKR
jgi:hypothetical protein